MLKMHYIVSLLAGMFGMKNHAVDEAQKAATKKPTYRILSYRPSSTRSSAVHRNKKTNRLHLAKKHKIARRKAA